MKASKIQEHIIKANFSRLKIISLISLGFSVFALVTDFVFHGVWGYEHAYLYKILDIVLAIISLTAISFFWFFKIRNITLQKIGILLFPFLIIIWAAIVTGIGFSMFGFSTLILVVLLIASFLYLNLLVSILYFVGLGSALMLTILLMGEINDNYLSLTFMLIPIIAISVIVSVKTYKYKRHDLVYQEKMGELNKRLNDSVDNLEEEVEKRTKGIVEALVKAEESDRLKSAFLTNMSHEIRTPMNGILGFTNLLKKQKLSSEKQHKFIEIIEKSGERLLNTIDSIIDISQIESGLVQTNIEGVDINETMDSIYTFLKPGAEKKGLMLLNKNTLSSNDAFIKTDKKKIDGILTILVKNAIKFTKKGSIEFGYQKKGKHLEFFVKDTGIGIPKNRQAAIFERFVQADIEDKNVWQGSGLGLAITKAYVDMLGGKIWVESEEGQGSTFYFNTPYNPVSEEEAQETVALVNKEEQLKYPKVLVVDDDEISSSLLSEELQVISKEILYAVTGVEAIEKCKSNPDLNLILMDIRMPVMGGLEATRQIRGFNKDIIIIAQTAYAQSGDREKAIEAGCNDYISKPIDITVLYKLIKKHNIKKAA